MDVKSSKYLQDPDPFFHSHVGVGVKTMGRSGFNFNVGSRKNFPSKWDDAEKWVINNGNDSPAHGVVNKSQDFVTKKQDELSVTKDGFIFQGPKVDQQHCSLDKGCNGGLASESSDLVVKDKFANELEPVFPKFRSLESMNEKLAFKYPVKVGMEVVQEVKSRDTGTEMTPIGSSTTSRSPTPIKSLSPPRYNTPEGRLASLALMDQSLQECHLAKISPWTPFDTMTPKWSSKEDEDEELSQSLRLFEMHNDGIIGPRPSAWEEKSEPCIRYQIEEARIKAWVNLQKAKVEAESRKLEMKIQKMRSKYEEKFMRKMTLVQRKADELRTTAKVEHSTMTAKSKKTMNRHPSVHFSNHHHSCNCLVGN